MDLNELNLEGKLNTLYQNYNETNLEKLRLGKDLSELEKLHETQIGQYIKFIQLLKDLYKKQISKLYNCHQVQIVKINTDKNKYKSELAKTLEEMHELENKIIELEAKVKETDLKGVLAAGYKDKVKILENQIANITQENNDISNKYLINQQNQHQLQVENERLNNTNTALESSMQKLKSTNEKFQMEIKHLQEGLKIKAVTDTFSSKNCQLDEQNEDFMKTFTPNNDISQLAISRLFQVKQNMLCEAIKYQIENKYKSDMESIKHENMILRKEVEDKYTTIESQRKKWESESKKLEVTLEELEKEKGQLVHTLKNSFTKDTRKLYGIIRNIQAKLIQERNNKGAQIAAVETNLRSKYQELNQKHFVLMDENAGLKSTLAQIQRKLNALIAENESLAKEYGQVLKQTNQNHEIDVKEKMAHMTRLINQVTLLKEQLITKTSEYKKKKQIYCKIIVKLRNQLKLACETSKNERVYHDKAIYRQVKDLKIKEIPRGDRIIYKVENG